MKITCPPGVLVIDGNKYNHHFNMSELINGGVKAVILGFYKGNWTASSVYPYYKYPLHDNCKRLADQVATSGIPLMSFFYYYVKEDPNKEVDWFLEAMRPYPVKYAWGDIEDITPGYNKPVYSEQSRKFMLQLHSLYANSGCYGAKWYVDAFGTYLDAQGQEIRAMDAWLPLYTQWVAQYKYRPTLATSMSWEELKLNWLPNYDFLISQGMLPEKTMGHQFTGDRCMLPGVYNQFNVRMTLDVSVFNADFIKNLGTAPLPPVPPVPPVVVGIDFRVISWQLNIRKGPGTAYPVAYTKIQGDVLKVANLTQNNGYVRLTDGNYAYFSYLQRI
jgi:hypothetical protein